MDYCDTSDEVEKNPNIKQELMILANGNADAFKLVEQSGKSGHSG